MEAIGRKRHPKGGLATSKSGENRNRSSAGGFTMRKALVALPVEVWDIIDRDLGDTMGKGYSDTIRSIVLAWLSENGYLVKGGKGHAKEK